MDIFGLGQFGTNCNNYIQDKINYFENIIY